MEYIIIAFRSRTQTVKMAQLMNARSITCEIVNTPKEAGVGCGLSVKISPFYFERTKKLVFDVGFSAFAGFFLVKITAGKKFVRSI